MDARDVLSEAASRPATEAKALVDALPTGALNAHAGGHTNSIAWLLWHAGRQMDVQLAQLLLVNGRRRLREQVLRALRLGEGDHVADRFGARHQCGDAVDAEGDAKYRCEDVADQRQSPPLHCSPHTGPLSPNRNPSLNTGSPKLAPLRRSPCRTHS